MWRGSCRGAAVDIAAPAQNVFKANRDSNASVGQGQGTSFAVALTAGCAALWLAHHGRSKLVAAARQRNESLQGMFRRLVRATARRPDGWDPFDLGAGIVDARALLEADLDLEIERESVLPPDHGLEPGYSVAGLVAENVALEAVNDPELDWTKYGPELATAILTEQLAAPSEDGPQPEFPQFLELSNDLQGSLANPVLRDHFRLDDDLADEVGTPEE
jgi:serine protease